MTAEPSSLPVVTIESRSSGATASGTPYTRFALTWAGSNAYVYAPDSTARNTHTVYVALLHGRANSREFAEGILGVGVRDAALDAGWVVSCLTSDATWGNDIFIGHLQALYNWAGHRWWLDSTITAGHSMGGMASLVVGERRPLPGLAGVASINGMIDTQAYRDTTTLTAYGASSWDDLLVKQAGHDPVRDDPEGWRGLPIWLTDNGGDGSTAKADLFVSRAVTPDLIERHTGTHTHVQNPFDADLQAWVTSLAPAYTADQTAEWVAVPMWDGWESKLVSTAPYTSGAVFTNGSGAVLMTTSGTWASISLAERAGA